MTTELRKIGPFTTRFYFMIMLIMSVLVYPFSYYFSDVISNSLGFIWPNSKELAGFCKSNICTFTSSFVISLYVCQIILYISFISFCTISLIFSKSQSLRLDKTPLTLIIIFSWILFLVQGIFGDLSFQKHNILYYNSVSASGIGIIRLTVIGIFCSIWASTAI